MMGSRFFSGNGMRSFAQRRNPTFGNRFVNRGGRFFDRRDQFRDRSFDRGGRFGNERFGREGRFEREERFENEEREEHEFFFRHNFFVAFDFGAFGFWPWWWWGWPGWWDGGYPYYGYYPYYSDPPTNGSQYGAANGYQYGAANGSQYGADYWNNLAVSVQTKLADQGYYHGQVDGVIGSGTMEAVRRFQADHGLKVTGKIDPGLLDALGISYKSRKAQP